MPPDSHFMLPSLGRGLYSVAGTAYLYTSQQLAVYH
jgi:hypothetical protein